jgi:acetylglutamate kinase
MDKEKNVISKIHTDEIEGLIADGTVSGGMIPKLESAANVVMNSGVGGVVILNGKDPQAIERELFTEEGGGTLIVKR